MLAEHNPKREWQDIAAEASHEKDPTRLVELTNELERALEERDKQLKNPNGKKEDAKNEHA
jgi:hypothetical protein